MGNFALALLLVLPLQADTQDDSATLASGFAEQEGVIVADASNFDSVVNAFDLTLVEFYAPWCGHCKALKPEYEKAAKKLVEIRTDPDLPSVKLAMVDAIVETDLAEKYQVQGFPTLKLFKKGSDEPTEYEGARTSDGIVSWLEKKSGPAVVNIIDEESLKTLRESAQSVVFGVFPPTEGQAETEAFTRAALDAEKIFGSSSEASLAESLGMDVPGIVVFKKFDESEGTMVKYEGDLTDSSAIARFAEAHALPEIIDFSEDTAQAVFGGKITSHVLLFGSEAQTKPIRDSILPVAKELLGDMLFLVVDSDVEEHDRILEFFGIEKEDLPTMRIADLEGDAMSRYVPDFSEFNEETVRAWTAAYTAGSLEKFLKSSTLPDNWDAQPVKVLVGSNFKEVAFDEEKHVFVEFYAPWCGHCKQLAPIWEKLASSYESSPEVVIAKLDATENDVAAVNIESFPTLILYPAGRARSNEPESAEFDGERNLDTLLKFVAEHTGVEGAPSDSNDGAAQHEEL